MTAGEQEQHYAERYGQDVLDVVRRFQPAHFDRRLALRDMLDPAFTTAWLNYNAGLFAREHLDVRTRTLVLVGQFTMARYPERLRDVVTLAVHEGVDLREVLEVILQCVIYAGDVVLDEALEVFTEVAEEHGKLEELREGQLPPDGTDAQRDLETERETWDPQDAADPRLEGTLERFGWLGVSTALRMRPRWALDLIEFLEGLDEEFPKLWLEATYHRMYSRGILDDKTRLLTMVGDLLAIGEVTQSRRHMRGALRQGASPREILEVAYMGCAVFGHPTNLGEAVKDFVKMLDEEYGGSDQMLYPDSTA